MAPPNSRSFSVKVVLPASGCEMMAKVRRRSISPASGERLWPAPGARIGAFIPGYLQSHGPDSRHSERRIESKLAFRLFDGELAVIFGHVVDARRAACDREQGCVGGGFGRQRTGAGF